jgi:hypothetical protein
VYVYVIRLPTAATERSDVFVTVTQGPAGQAVFTSSAALIVTAPFLASARPFRVPPLSVILVSARIVPPKVLFVPMVADMPICQNTLHGDAPLIKDTVELVAVVRELPIWKIHCALGSPPPSSVRLPVSPADDEKK